MNHRKSENAYNIYEATGNIELDTEKCPFTGLPAVHLKLMCSPIAGLLTRIERKLFFAQSKDYYAGILDKWILLYPSKSNDMKPSDYFYPKSIEMAKGDNHQFTVITNIDKRYHFQAPNSEEFYEWVVNINRIIDELTTGKVRESQMPQLLTRKLPSLPQVNKKDESYYTPQSINSNEERLYEEPCSSMHDEIDNGKTEEERPKLPIKTGKKNTNNDEMHSYDTPKSNKAVNEEEIHVAEINEEKSQSTEGSTTTTTPCNKAAEMMSPRGLKVSEMTAILSSINLSSPEEEKLKSSNMIKERKSIENSINNINAENSMKKDTKSPVKKWFTRRIMRGKKQHNRVAENEEVEEVMEGEGEKEEEDVITSVKGSKVNMIINQLEKSGQLKTLKKGFKSRKSLVYECSEEYEPVCVKNRN